METSPATSFPKWWASNLFCTFLLPRLPSTRTNLTHTGTTGRYEAFAGSALPCLQKLAPQLQQFTPDGGWFTLKSLKDIWSRFQAAGGGGFSDGTGMTLPKFRKFMVRAAA